MVNSSAVVVLQVQFASPVVSQQQTALALQYVDALLARNLGHRVDALTLLLDDGADETTSHLLSVNSSLLGRSMYDIETSCVSCISSPSPL